MVGVRAGEREVFGEEVFSISYCSSSRQKEGSPDKGEVESCHDISVAATAKHIRRTNEVSSNRKCDSLLLPNFH